MRSWCGLCTTDAVQKCSPVSLPATASSALNNAPTRANFGVATATAVTPRGPGAPSAVASEAEVTANMTTAPSSAFRFIGFTVSHEGERNVRDMHSHTTLPALGPQNLPALSAGPHHPPKDTSDG